jgi:hypothetical protein
MCRSILDLLSNERRSELASLAATQQAELANIVCSHPSVGNWIDEFEMPFLLEMLSADDEDIATNFPGVELSGPDRHMLCDAVIEHAAECPHCQLKMKNDAELEAAIHRESDHGREYASAVCS